MRGEALDLVGSMRIFRFLCLIAVILGITLPQTSAALSAMAAPGAMTIVICTGNGLETLTLDDVGNPVEQAEKSAHHCLLMHAADTGRRVSVGQRVPGWRHAPGFASIEVATLPARGPHDGQPRAPPVT
ncbi:hypothetical protein SAMN05421688_2456 [Poseidonocella pacifica]|uniref:DUF2946 domain-containing protein n=1 Tax=Poseidonocella pacifica TaxID=871651 RepID=A0A1I0XT01_9RHOB|nr:hypothetical protein [Poseidonocella pacifica]SFB04132.1 hypothetical protein SAMN05421688_2456 [Poseidonocella pacifica]